ncbi:NAD(+) synthase [Azohydromonas caseinilytica]|uniref:Glutamine-dependent NAD(+) synthetase n=1 Tax=Azohydromonas caseinilytica TaxID=2728836 RepID=A0A848FDD3_9BURK|nr:NAD(+) synthase [Azohydromonas caseinilytica]NML15941.1 NAD(+) synthase [Azohydromonas caseinilytica]
MSKDRFHSLYTHGFIRTAVCVPRIRLADPQHNAQETLSLLRAAHDKRAVVALFPELGLVGYTCDDLFHQRVLLDEAELALARLVQDAAGIPVLGVVGIPLRVDERLFNCAVVFHRGRILGVVPKTYLPNYGEFYEARQFNSAVNAVSDLVTLAGQTVPFGTQLLFQAENHPLLKLHVEICEDAWVPIPPSTYAALAGATVMLNLSASNITIGKSGYRHELVGLHSARCLGAYLYSASGPGESTNDMAWDGHGLAYENGVLLAETERFKQDSQLITADIDLERLLHERMRMTTFGATVGQHKAALANWRTVLYQAELPAEERLPLQRYVPRMPYVPANPAQRDERCREVFNIQVQALVQRLRAAGITKLVIGVSGGLDSTHALLVCAKAVDLMGLPRSNILGYTMPGFATSGRTLDQALRLMAAIGCSAEQIDIRPSCLQMLKDLGHPAGSGEAVYDVTFENVQAGERTSHLFRLANLHGGIVIGTGDLSELALGWCTYGVGDHMSHYGVNASVPKTLMQYLVRWVAETGQVGEQGSQVLLDILGTEISPELVPGGAEGEQPAQSTESAIGPYELQDFNLFHILRYGYDPSKVAFLAYQAWCSGDHAKYSLADVRKHLNTFLRRFFANQFKRTCVPNSPKVGSGGSLSPRGDWRAPSDASANAWLAELERNVPEE